MGLTFTQGATIYSGDEKVGVVSRVIVDPQANEVSHVVADEGLLFTTSRLIPVDLLAENRGTDLVMVAGVDLTTLSDFETSSFRAPSSEELAGLSLGYGASGFALVTAMPKVFHADDRRAPAGLDEAIGIGDAVAATDGVSVGNVESVSTDDAGNIRSLTARKGLIFRKRRIIPAAWIDQVDTGIVRLDRTSAAVDAQARMP